MHVDDIRIYAFINRVCTWRKCGTRICAYIGLLYLSYGGKHVTPTTQERYTEHTSQIELHVLHTESCNVLKSLSVPV